MNTKQTETAHVIKIESTEQLNLDPSMFGSASQVEILAQWERGARISVPAVELEFVEAALEADDNVISYVVVSA
jgi:hypothetical protein